MKHGNMELKRLTMRAARIRDYGTPDAIVPEGLDLPVPASGEVLVRVNASGVGNWDALVRSGRSGLALALPLTLGAEVSGKVEQVGNGSNSCLKHGDAVYGATNSLFIGGYADYATCAAGMLARRTNQLTDIKAASLPVAAVMALQMLERARVATGQTVVIHGAAGNVGAFAVQITHSLGARVIGTVRTSTSADRVRELGADEVIELEGAARFAKKADVVLDTVGGRSQSTLFQLIKPDGVLVSSVSPPDAVRAARNQVRADYFLTQVNTASLNSITALVEAGTLTTRLGAILQLSEVRLAHEMLDGTRQRPNGKIVLHIA
jgi:NADPH:quinone reductase-like Zn-dependent oxidoreductase